MASPPAVQRFAGTDFAHDPDGRIAARIPAGRCLRPQRRLAGKLRERSNNRLNGHGGCRFCRTARRHRRGRDDSWRGRRGRGEIPAARTDLHTGTPHADGDRSELAIELRIGRVVAEQVVRGQVGDDPFQRAADVVGADDGRAVGAAGQPAQRVRPLAELCAVLLNRRWPIGTDRRIEDGQPARIDRVERGVGPVRLIEQARKLKLVVELGEADAILLALRSRPGAGSGSGRVSRGEPAVARIDVDRRQIRAGGRRLAASVLDRADTGPNRP